MAKIDQGTADVLLTALRFLHEAEYDSKATRTRRSNKLREKCLAGGMLETVTDHRQWAVDYVNASVGLK